MGSYKLRVRILIAPFLLIAIVMIGKLYFLQIVHGSEYAKGANRSAMSPQAGVFNRGSIYFTENNGTSIAAATLKSGYILAIKPTEVHDAEKLYAQLSAIVPLERQAFIAKATKEGDPYEEVARHISETDAAKIRALKLQTSVVLENEQWRYYPGVQLASQVIGFVGYDGNVLNGRYGLEKYYDDALTRDGGNLYVNFFAEIFSTAKDFFASADATDGDLITTIEPTVELALERELKGIAEEYHPKKVGGIIMNPKTGEIYAMASYPTFDLNEYGSADPEWFKNPMVEERYEMGSIIKPLTMAAGIDSGTVTANTTYDDKGFVKTDGATVSNYDKKGRGVVPMQEVLNQSLNTGVSFVVDKMGNALFSNYMRGYGLGEETGIDLPGEIPGDIKNLDAPRKLEHFTASFGQGIAITPIETVRALATLGNGGLLITPHVVKAIRNDTGVVRELAQPEPKRVISEATSHEISRMLTVVVDKALAHGGIKLEHTSVAAKTGTAQIADPVNGGYYESRYLHSFFGYFPSYNPQFIIFLFALEPQNVQFASETLTQPFHHLTTFLLNYYDVPPDR
jgi:stage V sporulation protein D (sporulation-specific penicillin-binding protein)